MAARSRTPDSPRQLPVLPTTRRISKPRMRPLPRTPRPTPHRLLPHPDHAGSRPDQHPTHPDARYPPRNTHPRSSGRDLALPAQQHRMARQPRPPPRHPMHHPLPTTPHPMTRPGDPRTGRRWMALVAHVIARDHGICWRCGHEGADTGGHVLPIATHPQLALDPENLRAEHGTRRRIATDGFDCIGNYAAGARDAGQIPGPDLADPRRRQWLEQIDDDHIRYRG